jgi:hypothetical protein
VSFAYVSDMVGLAYRDFLCLDIRVANFYWDCLIYVLRKFLIWILPIGKTEKSEMWLESEIIVKN